MSCPLLNECGPHLVHLVNLSPRIVHICKTHAWTTKDPVFQGYTFIDRDIVLNLASLSDSYIRADHHILADVAILANPGI